MGALRAHFFGSEDQRIGGLSGVSINRHGGELARHEKANVIGGGASDKRVNCGTSPVPTQDERSHVAWGQQPCSQGWPPCGLLGPGMAWSHGMPAGAAAVAGFKKAAAARAGQTLPGRMSAATRSRCNARRVAEDSGMDGL